MVWKGEYADGPVVDSLRERVGRFVLGVLNKFYERNLDDILNLRMAVFDQI
jgi:hypothetical protein